MTDEPATPASKRPERDEFSEISISILIQHDNLDPDEVTHILNIEPTKGWRKGDKRRFGGTYPTYPFGGWDLSLVDDVATFGIEDALVPAIRRLLPLTERIRELRAIHPEYILTLIARAGYTEVTPWLSLKAAELADLAKLGVNFSIDLNQYARDEE